MLISVCIATYKRPELLKKLLQSLAEQELNFDLEIEAIVVDNDRELTAREIVKNFNSTEKIKFIYFSQPEKNISLTRNVAVNNAKGEYLLFIDDDEFADKKWISSLINCVKKYKADGAFGRVLSYFCEDTPEWKRKSFFFNRPASPSGTTAAFTRTTNSIVKASLVKSVEGPFDPEYGITGGEDTQLFGALKKQGAKFVNCYEAVTMEYIPPERTKLLWLLRRAFRLGNNFTRRSVELAKNKKFLVASKHLVKGFFYEVSSILLVVINIFSKARSFHWILKAAANLGKIAAVFGYQYKEYD